MGVEGAALGPKQPDPNVQVPAAVKRAAERSEELSRQAAEARKNAPPEANAPVQVEQPQSHPNPGVIMARFDPNNPEPPGEPQMPPPRPVGQALQQPAPAGEVPNWEHQFNSMKGRYDRTEQENKRLAGQIGDMQRLIAQMNVAPQPQPQPQPQQEGSGVRFSGPITGRPPPKRVTDKEITDYGADFIDVVGRRAMEVNDVIFQPQFQRYDDRIAQLERRIGGVQQTVAFDAQTRMYQQLDREIPNWKQINSHPDFVNWLQMPDALSGRIRHDMLGEAYNSTEANRVLEFFRRFLNDMQAHYGPANGGQQPGNGALTASSEATTPQANLLSLAAPGRAKTGQTQYSPDKPMFTVAEIKQFYTDSANGHYKGREDEYNRIQQEIFAAGRDGRVSR